MNLPLFDQAAQLCSRRLAAVPGMMRVPTPRLEMFILRDFLDEAQCAALIARIEQDRRPSTLADPNGDNRFRTSETCDLPMLEPDVIALDERLSALSGIDRRFGEPIQGQRYEPGQEFKAHTDYFEPSGADFARFCNEAGQRTWTFMVYLNTVEAGGATRFKVIDKTIQPETGKLVCWNNRRTDGSCNPATLHHAMKVRKGLKYVITKWYRERPWGLTAARSALGIDVARGADHGKAPEHDIGIGLAQQFGETGLVAVYPCQRFLDDCLTCRGQGQRVAAPIKAATIDQSALHQARDDRHHGCAGADP